MKPRSVLECGDTSPLSQYATSRVVSSRGHVRTLHILLLGFIILHSAFILLASGQSYSVDWSKIAGGGGTSTGGVYSASGTIGQPDASGPLTNGQYAVVGGFWALPVAVPTPGSPTLTIAPAAPGFATISWTPNTAGFTLQSSESLAPAHWGNVPGATNPPVTVPATLPVRFYRLLKPAP